MNVEKFIERINYLKEGKTLRLVHKGFNFDVNVKMNPQQNRIYIDRNNNELYNNLTEQQMNHFLMWDCGDWFLVLKEPTVEYIRVEVEGTMVKL